MKKLSFNGEMTYAAFLAENHLKDTTENLNRFLTLQDAVTIVNGYTVKELKEAFDMVADKDDWKAPIDAWINVEDEDIVFEAISYFTATEAWVTDYKTNYAGVTLAHINAIGYRNGPAGP